MGFQCCSIIPSGILEKIALQGTAVQRQIAFETLNASAGFRGQRQALAGIVPLMMLAPGVKQRTIYDAKNGLSLPGTIVRTEQGPASNDLSVNEAFEGSGEVYDFFRELFGRNSIDDNGMRMDSTVHYRQRFNNAFWNGMQMVYGDGDGQIFNRFTRCIDVIGHEMTHGITQYEAGLNYEEQSGALNEHISDVFGSMIKQYALKQTANQADWLIGQGLFTANIAGVALRSMRNPGTAYDDPLIGKDPQPAHMSNYVNTTSDNGGVHINSGIPNKAFCDLAISFDDYSWEKAGKIWYVTLTEKIVKVNTQFQEFAELTKAAAGQIFGLGGPEQQAVVLAWSGVGINV